MQIGAIDLIPEVTGVVPPQIVNLVAGLVNHFPTVRNSSGPSLLVWLRVQTELLPNWRSGLSINLNRQLGYGLMVNSQPI